MTSHRHGHRHPHPRAPLCPRCAGWSELSCLGPPRGLRRGELRQYVPSAIILTLGNCSDPRPSTPSNVPYSASRPLTRQRTCLVIWSILRRLKEEGRGFFRVPGPHEMWIRHCATCMLRRYRLQYGSGQSSQRGPCLMTFQPLLLLVGAVPISKQSPSLRPSSLYSENLLPSQYPTDSGLAVHLEHLSTPE